MGPSSSSKPNRSSFLAGWLCGYCGLPAILDRTGPRRCWPASRYDRCATIDSPLSCAESSITLSANVPYIVRSSAV